jgi:hypothetical protein
MKSNQKAVFIGIAVFIGLLFALPATRDELDWYWARSRDQAIDYLQYSTDWPKGRHVAEAKLCYEQRTWKDTKTAMINEALKKHAADKEAKDPKEKRKKMEHFFWKEVTNEDTIVSYKDYLLRYPNGEFAAQARNKIDALSRQAAAGGPTNSVDQQ